MFFYKKILFLPLYIIFQSRTLRKTEIFLLDQANNLISTLVFFYDEEETEDVEDIMDALKTIDEAISDEEVEFVSCSEDRVVESFGLTMIPSLVYFENRVPSVYQGDLKNADTILGWITQELQQQIIRELLILRMTFFLISWNFIYSLYLKFVKFYKVFLRNFALYLI